MKKWEKPQITLVLLKTVDIIKMSIQDVQDELDNEGKDQIWD